MLCKKSTFGRVEAFKILGNMLEDSSKNIDHVSLLIPHGCNIHLHLLMLGLPLVFILMFPIL